MPQSTANRVTLQIREAYLNTKLSMLAGWQITAACADANCLAGEPILVGQLLTRHGDHPLKAITTRLRCRICQAPAERVCLRQPSAGGLYIEHVVVAPIAPGRND